METRAQLDPEVIERLEEQSGLLLRMEEQSGLLLRTYQAQFAKDPTSHATESSRSNLIALRHTISQISGESTALDVTNALEFASAHLGQLIANAEK